MSEQGLHRRLGLFEVTALSVGFMGPVMAMALNGIGIANLVGKAVPFTFIVSFVGTLLVAYAFIRLTRFFTHAGSVYALAGSTLGPRAGFFGGFALLGTYVFFAACITGACAVFFEAMLGQLGLTMTGGWWVLVPLVVAALALLMNTRESLTTTRVLLAIGFLGIIAMVILAVIVIVRVGGPDSPVSTGVDLGSLLPSGAGMNAVMTASVFGFLSWAGFESGTSLSEEAKDPHRTIPRALLFAVVLAGFLYTFIMFAQTIGYGTDEAGIAAFAGASSTLTDMSSIYIGAWFAVLISVIAFVVALASLVSSTAAASRLLFALARDGFGPATLGRVNVHGVPAHALYVVLAVTLVLVLGLFLGGQGSIEVYYWYATIATLCMVVAYGMTSVGAIRYAISRSPVPRWEAVVPVLGLGYLAYVFLVQLVGQEPPYTYFPIIAGVWCLTGLIVVLVAPGLADRIGARLTREELE